MHDQWEVGLLEMKSKHEDLTSSVDLTATEVHNTQSQTTIDIVDVIKQLGVTEEQLPESIQQIMIKYQSIQKL